MMIQQATLVWIPNNDKNLLKMMEFVAMNQIRIFGDPYFVILAFLDAAKLAQFQTLFGVI